MTRNQIRELEGHLTEKLQQLRGQDVHGERENMYCADDNEYASRVAEMRLNTTLLKRTKEQIGEIKEALRRIHVADYGACDECGEDIPFARLKARPTSTTCVGCQEKLEQQSRGFGAGEISRTLHDALHDGRQWGLSG